MIDSQTYTPVGTQTVRVVRLEDLDAYNINEYAAAIQHLMDSHPDTEEDEAAVKGDRILLLEDPTFLAIEQHDTHLVFVHVVHTRGEESHATWLVPTAEKFDALYAAVDPNEKKTTSPAVQAGDKKFVAKFVYLYETEDDLTTIFENVREFSPGVQNHIRLSPNQTVEVRIGMDKVVVLGDEDYVVEVDGEEYPRVMTRETYQRLFK